MKSAQIELPAADGICCVSCWFYYREQRARGKGRPADIVFSFPAECGSQISTGPLPVIRLKPCSGERTRAGGQRELNTNEL